MCILGWWTRQQERAHDSTCHDDGSMLWKFSVSCVITATPLSLYLNMHTMVDDAYKHAYNTNAYVLLLSPSNLKYSSI